MGGKGSGLRPILCSHGILGKSKCSLCHGERNRKWWERNREICLRISANYQRRYPIQHRKCVQKWKQNNPEKSQIHNLVVHHPNRYPLDDNCVFCQTTEHLEHAHLDYEDYGFNYVTACHRCNCYMAID